MEIPLGWVGLPENAASVIVLDVLYFERNSLREAGMRPPEVEVAEETNGAYTKAEGDCDQTSKTKSKDLANYAEAQYDTAQNCSTFPSSLIFSIHVTPTKLFCVALIAM